MKTIASAAVLCALATGAAAQIVGPDSYNLAPFAQRLLRERARCWVVGDSESDESASTNNSPYGLVRELTPTHWAGISCFGINSGTAPTFEAYYPGLAPALCGFGGSTNPHQLGVQDDLGGAGENIWPCKYACTAQYPSDIPGPGLLTSWIANPALAAPFSGGDWWSGAEGRVRLVTYHDAGSVARVGSYCSRGGVVTSVTYDIALQDGYNFIDMPAGTGPGNCLPQWSVSSQSCDETGLVQRNFGCRFYAPSVQGLELSFGGCGGARVQDHLNPALVSDEAIAAAVAWGDLDTVILWLGVNDFWTPEWIDQERGLIARWAGAIRTAGRDPRVLLVCNFDVEGRSDWMAHEQWDMLALAQEDPQTVSFCNLFKLAGPYTELGPYYRGDGLHTNEAGAVHFAHLINADLVASLGEGGGPACGSADFDGDGDLGTDADIEAFFACLGGVCCPACDPHGADFDGDGDLGTDSDIESFFRVLGGGPC